MLGGTDRKKPGHARSHRERGPPRTENTPPAGVLRPATMTLPGKTEAGSAGMQPCRGIAWRAHRDDVHGRGSSPFALFLTPIGSVDPDALKIPARRAECSLTENAHFPFHAEPTQPPDLLVSVRSAY